MSSQIHIVAFTGCLREQSYNRAALRAAQELLPEQAELEILTIDHLPQFDQALVQDEPEEVRSFKEKIQQADAVLIATPEYKGLLPHVLTNALNWAGQVALSKKLTAIMGVGRQTGTEGELQQVRQLLATYNAVVLEEPEVYVGSGWEKFDSEGRLTDEEMRQQMRVLLNSLVVRVNADQGVLVG